MNYLIFKRLGDLFCSFVLLILLAPLMFLLIIIIAFDLKGNPFFLQIRPGHRGKLFSVIKFRTMSNKRDSEGKLLPDMDRISKLGMIIRSASLDELPQLVNVLIGNMSFIGPRPLLTKYLDLYSEEQKRRHSMKPGITGWAQVNGRNAISWTQKFEYDLYYVNHVSFALDVKILLKTFWKVMRRTDVNSSQSQTMPPFNGVN